MERFYRFLCWITAIVVIEGQARDPCGSIKCELDHQQCRLLEVACPVGEECPPEPMCIDRQVIVASCRYGSPLMRLMENGRYTTPRCSFNGQCPDNTECYEAHGTESVCCWTPFPVEPKPFSALETTPTTKPARPETSPPVGEPWVLQNHCATNFPLPRIFCNWVVPTCQKDSDCTPGLKCCHTEKCGRKGCLLARLQKECSFFDKLIGIC